MPTAVVAIGATSGTKNKEGIDPAYALQGHKVEYSTHGIYVVNGKKSWSYEHHDERMS